MDSITAFGRGIRSQPAMLGSFRPQEPLPLAEQGRALFAGSGDSLAAAMLAEAYSGGLARAADPLEIARNPGIARYGRLYVVSVSGRTVSGVRAARGRGATAITSDPGSMLARACKGVIRVSGGGPVQTAGSSTFLECALACVSLVRPTVAPRGSALYEAARSAARGARITGRLFVLGSYHTYPLAMYCAAKFYEVLGYDAWHARTEQFFHMELFCAGRGDTVILLEPEGAHARRIRRALRGTGIRIIQPRVPGPGPSQIAYCAFFSQMAALYEARRRGITECHFVGAPVRGASDEMIY